MIKYGLCLVAALALGGCQSLVGAQSSCSSANPTYLAMWDCIKGRVAQGSAGQMNNAQGVRYMATGDLIAEQVRAGKLSDAQAKVALAISLERENSSFNAERRAELESASNGLIAAGAAMSAAAGPPPQPLMRNCNSYRLGNTIRTNCY